MRIVGKVGDVSVSDESLAETPNAGAAVMRGNRRRLLVFASVFMVSLVVGMAWNLMRPAEYRAVARVQLTLPALSAAGMAASAPAPQGGTDFVAQVQRLGSRPLIEAVHQRLVSAGLRVAPDQDDPVERLQSMIGVSPVAGSTVVDLSATGDSPAVLAAALNELIAVYREQLLASFGSNADQRLQETRDELARLEQAASQRRAAIERFRGGAGILSTEREENETVARTRGLATALNNAVEKQATAEARLRALEGAVESGQGALSARDDPTLASMENRASQLREELRDMARTYTEDFMAMDPRARATRTRLAEMESQIAQRRTASQEMVLAKAREDVATATANVERLQAQMAAERRGLSNFSVRFSEVKAMEDDLASIERARRETLERLARIEAGEKARRPSIDVLQPAAAPTSPWRPDYLRDGGLVLAGSFVLGLLAMGFVELFNRAPAPAAAAPMTVVVPSWPLVGGAAVARLSQQESDALLPTRPPVPAGTEVLEAPSRGLWELPQQDVMALLAATRGPVRLACALWLLGLSSDEVASLRCADVQGQRLHVGGAWARDVVLPQWLADELPVAAGPEAPLVSDGRGQPMSNSDLQTLLACAAIDAGLPRAVDLTPDQLRFTAIAWWVREGMRLADLPARAGRLDAQDLGVLADLAQAGPRKAPEQVEPLMPALRTLPST